MFCFFFFNDTATTEIYTLSLHDALPISAAALDADVLCEEFITGDEVTCPILGVGDTAHALPVIRIVAPEGNYDYQRSEEHTSELQSPCNLVCRLLLEKKNR